MPLPNTPIGIEKKCNDALNAVVAQLATYQADYAVAHGGKYYQGIRAHTVLPTNGSETAPTKSRKPTDQAEDWSVITLPPTMPVSPEVHVHDGPDGRGYTVFGWIDIAERVWRKRLGSGGTR